MEFILKSEGEKQRRINEAAGRASEIEQVATATANGLRAIAIAISDENGLNAVNLRLPNNTLMPSVTLPNKIIPLLFHQT